MDELIAQLDEWSNKSVGDGKWKVTPPGKVGVWRRAKSANANIFIPDDGSAVVGGDRGGSDGDSDSDGPSDSQKELLANAKATLGKLKDKLKTGNKKQKKLAKKKIPKVAALISALQSGNAKAIKKAAGSI